MPKSSSSSVDELIKKYASPPPSQGEPDPTPEIIPKARQKQTSKRDRLAALCKTASELQSKLKMEVNKINMFMHSNTDLTIPDSNLPKDFTPKEIDVVSDVGKSVDEDLDNVPGVTGLRAFANKRYENDYANLPTDIDGGGDDLNGRELVRLNLKILMIFYVFVMTFQQREDLDSFDVDKDMPEYYDLEPVSRFIINSLKLSQFFQKTSQV